MNLCWRVSSPNQAVHLGLGVFSVPRQTQRFPFPQNQKWVPSSETIIAAFLEALFCSKPISHPRIFLDLKTRLLRNKEGLVYWTNLLSVCCGWVDPGDLEGVGEGKTKASQPANHLWMSFNFLTSACQRQWISSYLITTSFQSSRHQLSILNSSQNHLFNILRSTQPGPFVILLRSVMRSSSTLGMFLIFYECCKHIFDHPRSL